jgi:hypothetical protein
VELLIQRVLRSQLLQVRQQSSMLPGPQPGLDEGPLDLQPQLIQAPRLSLQPGQAGQIRQWLPAPQGQRGPQVLCSLDRIGRLDTLPQQVLGDPHVGVSSAGVQGIAGRAGHDRGPVPKDLAQLGNVLLQRVQRGRRRAVRPDGLGQPVGTDDFAVVQRQHGQHRLTAQPSDQPRLPVHHDIDRPKQPHLHDSPPPAAASSASV